MKTGDLVTIAKTYYPRVGSPQRKVFLEDIGIIIEVIGDGDPVGWPGPRSVCKVMWESGVINQQWTDDLESVGD
jgi:hypothetical protein